MEKEVKAFIKEDINRIAATIALMYSPDIYEKTEEYINKPMANIAAGHALNVNWDNITTKFNIIKNVLSYGIYTEDVDVENTGNKIVKRTADKKIKVDNIILPVVIGKDFNRNFAFKTAQNELGFCDDPSILRDFLNVLSKEESTNAITKIDTNGTFNMWGGSRTITLTEEAKNYKLIIIKAGGSTMDVNFRILIPGQWVKMREHDRNGGGEMHIYWDGATSIKVNHYPHRDGREGRCEGVWGVLK